MEASGIRRRLRRLRAEAGDEAGIALLEVVVSALLVVIVAVGVLGAVEAATRSTSEERHRARAHGIAEEDLARMRSMRISDLSNLNQTRTVTSDGTPYTVVSRAEFATDATGTASCQAGLAAADYILITSTITWPSIGGRAPVREQSIVAPPNGSVSANSGSLAIRVENAQNNGIAGVGLSGSGAGSFSGSTGSNGCVIFGNLPAGNYTLDRLGLLAGRPRRQPAAAHQHQRGRREHQHDGAPVRRTRGHPGRPSSPGWGAAWSPPARTRSSSSTPACRPPKTFGTPGNRVAAG